MIPTLISSLPLSLKTTLLAAAAAGSKSGVRLFGIRLYGADWENGKKIIFTLALIAIVVVLRWVLLSVARLTLKHQPNSRSMFWGRQAVSMVITAVLVLGVISIWLDNPDNLSTAMGLATAGLAFALQKVITSFAGYFVILRGKTFSVGDRIVMGGVRGDVIALGFLQTTIMEMGQPSTVEGGANPAMWVKGRQFTGRVVTVSNGQIFDDPVYNYTRDFQYLWEEIVLPIGYDADRDRAEQILLDAARNQTVKIGEMSEQQLRRMQDRYYVKMADFEPKVFYRLTDNWLELTVRFVVTEHGIRDVKDMMSREILRGIEEAKIEIASATYDIVGLPPVRVERGAAADSDDVVE